MTYIIMLKLSEELDFSEHVLRNDSMLEWTGKLLHCTCLF